jgi:hypothetical protein
MVANVTARIVGRSDAGSCRSTDRRSNRRGGTRMESRDPMVWARPGVILSVAMIVVAGRSLAQDTRPNELRPADALSVHVLAPDGRPLREGVVNLFFIAADGAPFSRFDAYSEAEDAAEGSDAAAATRSASVASQPTTSSRRTRQAPPVRDELDEPRRAQSDPNGDVAFSLRKLRPIPPGTRLGARVAIDGRSYFGFSSVPAPVDVFHWNAGVVRLEAEPDTLSGVVVDEFGRPARLAKFSVVVARGPADLVQYGFMEQEVQAGDDGRFAIRAKADWPPPGVEATVGYGFAGEFPHVVRTGLGADGVRLFLPRRPTTLSGRIELAGLDPDELFVFVEQVRTPEPPGHWFHAALAGQIAGMRRAFGRIERDGSFVVEQAPTGDVSFVVGAGRRGLMGEWRPVPAEAELIRFDGVRLSADEPCRDPRMQTLSLSDRFVSARIRVTNSDNLPATGVVGHLMRYDGPRFSSERGVLRIVAARFPVLVRLSDGHPRPDGVFLHPHYGSAIVKISGDADVRLPPIIRFNIRLIDPPGLSSESMALRPSFIDADGELAFFNVNLEDIFAWSPEHCFDGPQELGVRWRSHARDSSLSARLNAALGALPLQRFLVSEELNGATVELMPPPEVIKAVRAALLPR